MGIWRSVRIQRCRRCRNRNGFQKSSPVPHTLRFPATVVANVNRFDDLVQSWLRNDDEASFRLGPPADRRHIQQALCRFEADKAMLTSTYEALCDLHDEHLNHIWSFCPEPSAPQLAHHAGQSR